MLLYEPMSTASPEQTLVPGDLSERLGHQRQCNESLTPTAEGYTGGAAAIAGMLPWVVHEQHVNTLRRMADNRYKADVFASPEHYATYLGLRVHDILRGDLQYETFARMAALLTGAALAHDAPTAAAQSRDFGERVIRQRARHAAVYLAGASIIPKKRNDLFDEADNTTLLDRASKTYGSTTMTPLGTTPRAQGQRFDALTRRIHDDDAFANALAAVQETFIPKGGRLKGLRFGIQLANKYRRLIKAAADPLKAAETVPEAFEMCLLPPDVELADADAEFLGEFMSKLNKYFSGAARHNEHIASDPRVPYLALLAGQLAGACNISLRLERFERTVEQAARREPNRASRLNSQVTI